jgi:hypothetical protein
MSGRGFTPKHHKVFHLLRNIGYQGNVRLYATWFDEALNKMLKAACRFTSQATFDRTVLVRMRSVLLGYGGV